MTLEALIAKAKSAFRDRYSDSNDKGWLWQMKTLNDVGNDARSAEAHGKDGIAYFQQYLNEINLEV
jgi:hypothetical protein